ncbi:MAG: SIR2 family protein [FCB group bacterium]|jgi:hypothetical protein|nr:SIR2 family protein [FCB group bacterium]
MKEQRFGLIFGAGLSKSFGVPSWDDLVGKLAADSEVDGERILAAIPPRAGLPYKTEMLFEHFRKTRYTISSPERHHTRELEYEIARDWRSKVRERLYAGVDGQLGTKLDSHPYLNALLPLIRKTHMTITYNFDDFIEQSLLHTKDPSERSSRGYETVTNPWPQFRRQEAIIYHPNGMIPQNVLEAPSDHLVFSEASFAEQLMGILAGNQAGLQSHLSKHTCLLIGLSLDDETLRSALMHGARFCPGNFHYYVSYVDESNSLSESQRQTISRANFKVYNLITLFLTNEEINALAEMIDTGLDDKEFSDFLDKQKIEKQFRFYVTGPMGVGKSTVINHFRNLRVLDEWVEERHKLLIKPWPELTNEEREDVDRWIMSQFRQKNDTLRKESSGIFMLDRGPLDPLAFAEEPERSPKAEKMLKAICGAEMNERVASGRVILLTGDCDDLALRLILSKREGYTSDKLKKMEKALKQVYGKDGVVCFDTRGLAPADVVRRVAEIVHLEDYDSDKLCDLHQRFEQIREDVASVQ